MNAKSLIFACPMNYIGLILFATLFSGAIQGIILVALLWNKRSLSNLLLSVLVFTVTCHLMLVAIDIQGLFIQLPHLSRISWVLPLLYGPLFLLITLSIAKVNFSLRPWHLVLLLPACIYFIILFPYFTLSAREKLAILTDTEKVTSADFGVLNHLTNYIHLFFISWSLVAFYRARKSLSEYYSEYSRVKLGWLRKFLWLIFSLIVFSIFAFYTHKYNWDGVPVLYPYHFLLVVILIYWLAYHIVLNPVSFAPSDSGLPKSLKYGKTTLSDIEYSLILKKLTGLMNEEKPFLDSELNINILSDQLRVKRHQLSQVINTAFSKNFYEYINDYRIAEFKRKIAEREHIRHSIIGLALNCGFKSKATFNAVFKKKENCTPSEYIRAESGLILADKTAF